MSGGTWRLIVDGSLPGARNMARDVAMLEAVIAGQAPPSVRLYGWSPSCLTLGRHQGLDAVDLAFCAGEGIDVARRPTGGRAVLHHLELTYAVVAPLGAVLPSALQEAYRRLCAGLVRGMSSLGIAAELTGGELYLRALVGEPDGSRVIRAEGRAPVADGDALGVGLAQELLAGGAGDILAALY